MHTYISNALWFYVGSVGHNMSEPALCKVLEVLSLDYTELTF